MDINSVRYLLYKKKAVLEAHQKAIQERIYKIENDFNYDLLEDEDKLFSRNWLGLDEEACQAKEEV